MIKSITSTVLVGASLLLATGAGAAEPDLSGLLGVDAAAMSDAELARVEGKGHDATPLGALLLSLPNAGKRVNSPAWDLGLSPARAMGNAQVGRGQGPK